ncbi:hypothetical protein Pmani_030565 [Petrolisthes manimaculis]|uniref:Uncharacterized protein n=1 Tax=Petrolisthes manimaculis TaxID=1843537 RepID=A0AAE1NX51_9EUCA|nr:hypothetical protein Pmani_030565 [Petrolisthes manimaculis]
MTNYVHRNLQSNREIILNRELSVLKKEEEVLVDLLKRYEEALNQLQVEELTIKSQLSHARKADLGSQNNTPVNSMLGNYGPAGGSSSIDKMVNSIPSESRHGISMNELQINQTTLNLDAAPLIQRMLHDSEVYDEEEDDQMEEWQQSPNN